MKRFVFEEALSEIPERFFEKALDGEILPLHPYLLMLTQLFGWIIFGPGNWKGKYFRCDNKGYNIFRSHINGNIVHSNFFSYGVGISKCDKKECLIITYNLNGLPQKFYDEIRYSPEHDCLVGLTFVSLGKRELGPFKFLLREGSSGIVQS